MKKNSLILIILLTLFLIALLLFFGFFIPHSYEPYVMRDVNGSFCDFYSKTCTCYGSLFISESMPPKYKCQGFNFCDERVEEMRNCRALLGR